MAQTELRLRLIKDGKIVGYERHINGKRWHAEIPIGEYGWEEVKIDHDSFELGIKVENKWWFEGDIGKDFDRCIPKFELMYNGATFSKKYYKFDEPIIRIIENTKELMDCERTGNIHEKETTERK